MRIPKSIKNRQSQFNPAGNSNSGERKIENDGIQTNDGEDETRTVTISFILQGSIIIEVI